MSYRPANIGSSFHRPRFLKVALVSRNVLGPGDYFGELALLNNDKRRATVRAVRNTVCLTLGRETFMRLLGRFLAAISPLLQANDFTTFPLSFPQGLLNVS